MRTKMLLNVEVSVKSETEVSVFCRRKIKSLQLSGQLTREVTMNTGDLPNRWWRCFPNCRTNSFRKQETYQIKNQVWNLEEILNLGQGDEKWPFIPFRNCFQSSSSPILVSKLLSFPRLPPFLVSPADREYSFK